MSIENIPMSSLISDLNDVNIINEEDYKEEIDINLDEIINNQVILDNHFINYVINNGNLEKPDDNPSVHILMKYSFQLNEGC